MWRSRAPHAQSVVAWGGLVALVLVVYVAVVLGGGLLIGRTESPHLGLSVLATLLVAAGVEPARIRLERLAGRLLNRGRPAPYDVLSGFAGQLQSVSSADEVTDQMARVLAEGTDAERAEIWLLVHGRLTLVANYPERSTVDPTPPSINRPVEADPRSHSVTVGHGGDVLGLLRVKEHANRPMTPVGERLFAGLAAQAGIVLHSARLQAELNARVDELSDKEQQLRQHREGLVRSQELERRRLERDLHDGAQQELVALTINLRLAKTLLRSDQHRTATLLGEQARAAADAIDTLTRLSGGVRPRVLDDDGLQAALTAAAALSPIPVSLEVSEVGRLPAELESAAYFCAVEALQNAAKHSGATRIVLGLCRADDQLVVRVADNGGGVFTDAASGTGLASMKERVASVGGDVRVHPDPGHGTSVVATFPAHRLVGTRS